MLKIGDGGYAAREKKLEEKEKVEVSEKVHISIESQRAFSLNEMHNSQKGFCFGKSYSNPKEHTKMFWELESKKTLNYSMIIIGGSGSGKTRLGTSIIKDLGNRNKHVLTVDVQGDMYVEGENTYKFSRRNNSMGFNYFTFTKDLENGGPISNSMLIIELYKNSVMENGIGPIQKAVFKQVIIDCYRSKGILDEDETTWENELPTPKHFEAFVLKILGGANTSKLTKLAEYANDLAKIKNDLRKDKSEKNEKKLNKLMEEYREFNKMFESYLFENQHEEFFEGMTLDEDKVDVSYYYAPQNYKTLQTLYTYIKMMADCPLFGSRKFPELNGLMRFDVSGFTSYGKPEEAIFFINYVFSMFFRAIKERGEYRYMSDAYKSRHGNFCDSFCFVDESKLILPNGKNKESPYHIINRIVTESRKYGGGMGIISQSVKHFPAEIINSTYTKVVLPSEESEESIKILNMKSRVSEKANTLFEHLREAADGVSIVGTTGGLYDSLVTPWYKRTGDKM